MKTRRTKEQVEIARRENLILEDFERNRVKETQSSKSFAEIDKHFTEAVGRLGKYALGLKFSFMIMQISDKSLGDMMLMKVQGRKATGHSKQLCKHILRENDPANFITHCLWECIGLARGIHKGRFG
jgi:hypothetical protein